MSADRPVNVRLVVLLIATSVALIAADRQDPSPFEAARASTTSAIGPAADGLDATVAAARGAWDGARGTARLEAENAELRRRLAEAEAAPGRADDDRAELARLLDGSDLDDVSDLPAVTARVVAVRSAPSGQVIEIDKGTDHGISPGMPVVTARGLVGTVTVAGDRRSLIQPITDPGVAVGVRSGFEYGLVTGEGAGRHLGLELEPDADMVVGPGDRLTTSGLDRSRYPHRLPVGEVVQTPSGELAVAPFTDPDRLGYVSVLLWVAP